MKEHRIALFGGGFDPIHFGHLNLAVEMKEKHQLDQIYFCPASCSPLKTDNPPKESKEERHTIVQLGVQEIEGFEVLDIEIQKEGPSYTIDTLKDLRKKVKGSLFLILSEDALSCFDSWKEPEEILQLAIPLIGRRTMSREYTWNHLPEDWISLFKKGLTQTRILDISSTDIRKRLFEKKYCGHLVPAKVLDYIYNNNLY